MVLQMAMDVECYQYLKRPLAVVLYDDALLQDQIERYIPNQKKSCLNY